MKENGSFVLRAVQLPVIIEELKDRMRKYPYQKIWLSYHDVSAGVQSEIDGWVRGHNNAVDLDIGR